MYRIVFKPGISAWVVQLECCFLFWRTIGMNGDWKMFPDYDQANDYVKKVGLDKVYQPWQDSYMARIAKGQQYAN